VKLKYQRPPAFIADEKALTYSINTAAMALDVCRSTVIHRIEDGTLTSVKFGGRRLILAASLYKVIGLNERGQ
jgi:excisionase family DNA binding protein